MKKNTSIKLISLLIVVLLTFLTIGFSAFSANMIVNDIIAYVRPKVDVRVSRVILDDGKSSGYTSRDYNYDVSNITGSFQLDNIGSTITYEIDVTVYEAAEMAINGVSILENGSGLSATISGYTLKTKLCDNNDNTKCNLNATRTMYVTIERTSGNTVNYNNVRIDFDFKEVYDIAYVNMNNTGYPSNILDGDDITINFSNNNQYNGTATYIYNTDTLVVNSYTNAIPTGFTVTGNNNYNFSNSVLTITNVTGDITITKQSNNTSSAVQTLLSLVDGYSDTSTNAINLGQGSDGCNIKLAYDGTADKNLRYIGLNPCNYVSFQGITWRIIGIFNNIEVDGKTEREKLIKLISAENYTSDKMEWHSTGSNNWLDSTLYTILNTTFYTSDLISSSYVEKVKWPLGGLAYNSNSPLAFYSAEKNTGNDSSSNTNHNPAGYVGLFYPSDYGHATDGGSDSGRTTCLNAAYNAADWKTNGKRVCAPNDWLYTETGSNYFWTITPVSNSKSSVYRIGNAVIGQVIPSSSQTAYVRPVIFLKSNVNIANGDGSSSTPYQLTQ